MKRLYLLAVVAVVACQGGSKTEPGATGTDAVYKAEIEELCDVINRTGTADIDPNDRAMKIATYLGSHVKSQEGRKFLSKIRPLKGNEKADALEAEGKRVGLTGCALAAEWRKFPATK